MKTTHGQTGSPTYTTWKMMKNRCGDPTRKDYAGRGIKVCDRWQQFENFVTDMGERPEGKTLDRIKTDGDYEPGNCRWATPLEQMNNRRTSDRLTWDKARKRWKKKYRGRQHYFRYSFVDLPLAVAAWQQRKAAIDGGELSP